MAGDDMAGTTATTPTMPRRDAAAEVLLVVELVLDPQAASAATRATPPTRVRARLINISAPEGRCAGKSGDDERSALWIFLVL